MWEKDVWYTVTKEDLELFMKTGSANADIAESLIDAFDSVDKIRFKVGVNLLGQVIRLYAENEQELHHRLEHHLGLNYWFEPNEVKYFTPESKKISNKLESVLNIRPINVDGYIIKNMQDWDLYLEQVIWTSKQEAAEKKRQEIKQLKADLEAAEKELAELVK